MVNDVWLSLALNPVLEDIPGGATSTIHSISLKLCIREKSFRESYIKTVKSGGIERYRLRFCNMHGLKMHHDPYIPCSGKAFFYFF